jgi:hypothetical protein
MSTLVVNLPLTSTGGSGGGGGDASAANQLITNNYLNQINQKISPKFSSIIPSFNATQDIYSKYVGAVLTETTTITYTDSSKETIASIVNT